MAKKTIKKKVRKKVKPPKRGTGGRRPPTRTGDVDPEDVVKPKFGRKRSLRGRR